MISCIRRIQFCAGHRVLNHESKCKNIHGHNYVMFFHARAPQLDSIGRVIDFSVLKEKLGGWVDKYWDHSFLINKEDKTLMEIIPKGMDNKPAFICDFNPTAENMAEYILKTVAPLLMANTGVEVFKVVVWETENCFAEACL